MARRLIEDKRGLPKDVRDALAHYHKMAPSSHSSSSEQLRYLKSKGLKPVTPLKIIRKMARIESKKSGVPIHITKNIGKGEEARTLGLAVFKTKTGEVSVRIHPTLQYRTKKQIRSVIRHELDHTKIYKRWKKYKY